MRKIDSKTVIPIGWALGGFSIAFSAIVIGVLWVSRVDYRLERIEEKLGVPKYQSANVALVHKAFAK